MRMQVPLTSLVEMQAFVQNSIAVTPQSAGVFFQLRRGEGANMILPIIAAVITGDVDGH
jgi:hypothetical protein